jgi:hypothetical protein
MSISKSNNTPEVDEVLTNDLKFKAKLDIGEDAYTSLKIKKYLLDAVDAGNGAITGAAIAKSSLVAGSFFAPTGILGAIGIGAAVTPIGWAIAAGTLGAGLSVIIGKKIVRGNSSRVTVIPEFINTPLDLLAVGLFDMIASLGLKIASIDGKVDASELTVATNYFVKEWGYSEEFVMQGINRILEDIDQHSIHDIATKLAEFKKSNPDCNYDSMSAEILLFLDRIIEADLIIDEREQMARDKVVEIFDDVNSFSFKETVDSVTSTASKAAKVSAEAVESAATGIKNSFRFGLKKNKPDQHNDSE